MKVYIAGKVSGDPEYRAKFNRAEERLKRQGYIVINPAVLPSGMDHADYARICAAMLDSADAVALLEDFGKSEGAIIEYRYSKYIKKKIIYLQEEDERLMCRCSVKTNGSKQNDGFQNVVTNADHIRSMNDDELADQLVIDVNGLESCTLYLSTPTGKMYLIRTDAANKVKEWLQQPIEEALKDVSTD